MLEKLKESGNEKPELANVQEWAFNSSVADISSLVTSGHAFFGTVGPGDMVYLPPGCLVSQRVHGNDVLGVRGGVLGRGMVKAFEVIHNVSDGKHGLAVEALKFISSQIEKDERRVAEMAKQKFEKEQAEKEQAKKERHEKEQAEKEHREKEQAEKERHEKEQAEKEQADKERFEKEQAEKEQADKERREKEQAEKAEQEAKRPKLTDPVAQYAAEAKAKAAPNKLTFKTLSGDKP